MSETSLKIKFGSPQLQNDSSQISLILHLQKQEKIQRHQQQISQAISKLRVPLLVLQLPSQYSQFSPKLLHKLFEQDSKFQTINGNNNISFHLYEPSKVQLITPLRKIENLMQSLNTLRNSFYINLTLYNLQDAIAKKKDLVFNLFENLQIEGKVDLDKNFIRLASQMLSKISPGFEESPLVAFLQLFGGAQLDLEFESPSVLTNATRESALPEKFELKQLGESKQEKLLKSMLTSKEKMRLYVHFGKLGYIEVRAEVRILALLQFLI